MKKVVKNREFQGTTINPQRLLEARKARGFSMTELATKISVTRQAISQFERGENQPTGTTMARLIEELKFPLAYFMDHTPDSDVPSGTIFFRSLQSKTRRHQDELEIHSLWVWRIYEYLSRFVNFPKASVPEYPDYSTSTPLSDEQIEEIANQVRMQWGLGMWPISDVTLLFEKNGIIISQFPFACEGMDAFSFWKGNRPLVFVRSDQTSSVRNRLNLAHELGHLILHSHIDNADLANRQLFKRIEDEAFRFAGAFLLPSETFGQEVISSSLDHFIELKKRWKVSIGAMIMRCETIGILSENQVLYLRQQMAKRRMRTWEPLDDELKLESPRVIRQATELILKKGVQTADRIIEAIKTYPGELEELCSLDSGTLIKESTIIPLSIQERRKEG